MKKKGKKKDKFIREQVNKEKSHFLITFGKLIVNIVSLPGLLSTVIVPLCASIIFCTILNPNPLLFALVVKNGSNILSIFSADIPFPVSEISIITFELVLFVLIIGTALAPRFNESV
jgi:hypothetical protein